MKKITNYLKIINF